MNKNHPALTTPEELKHIIDNMVEDITTVIDACTSEQYTWKNEHHPSSIGDHIRHTIEFIIELNNSKNSGVVNYDARRRDERIASNRAYAKMILTEETQKLQKTLKTKDLAAEVITTQDETTLASTFGKEAVSIPSHTTHHLAVIKPLLEHHGIEIDKKIGVARATLRHEGKLSAPEPQKQAS